ncbi:MAG: hypothetical protein ABID64_02865 [Nitrospirota bacterium]
MTYHCIVTDTCPVCGYFDSTGEVFGPNGEYAYQENCPSCGTQFGYNDCLISHRVLRKRWAKDGFIWDSRSLEDKPKNWNPTAQLKNLQLSDQEIKDLVRLSDPTKCDDWEFLSFRNLDEARKYKNIYLIMEGDYGRQIYLSAPIELIKCSEKILEKLLQKIDKIRCNDTGGAKICFEGMQKGQIISASVSKGIADNKLWVHKELEHMKDEINGILRGKRE